MTSKIKMKKILIAFLTIVIILLPISIYAENDMLIITQEPNATIEYHPEEQQTIDNIPKIGCKAAYVAEPITGKVIYEKNAHDKMYPASTTKILTALLALEKCDMAEKATVSQRAIDLVPEGYSDARLRVGEEIAISDLLYALLIPSANEAANVIAEHISGSVEEFAELSNNRAKELGCEILHFTNPNGIHDDDHYCCAYDLYLIAKECRKYDLFNEIVKTKKFTLPATNLYPTADRTFTNTNELLLSGIYNYQYCTGIKTGHTTPAGNCLVASSSNNGLDLISVVLGGGTNARGLNERFYDTKQLFEYTYDNYSIKEIVEDNLVVAKLNVGKATKETSELDAIVDSSISTIVPNNLDIENIEISISLKDNIEAPIEQNQVLGTMTFDADGLVYTTNIIASHPVEKLPYMLYNAIVASGILLSIFIFTILIRKSRKRREIVLLIIIIISIAEIAGIVYALKEGKEYANTKVTLTSNQVMVD